MKQRRFVAEFAIDGNASAAARRAGYSEKSAKAQGTENLAKPAIRAAIDAQELERLERLNITADRVKEELALIAFGDFGDFYDPETGHLLEVHQMPRDVRARLASVKVLRERTTRKGEDEVVHEATQELKVIDKVPCLQMLGRTFKMFTDKMEHGADVSLLDICRELESDEDKQKATVIGGDPA